MPKIPVTLFILKYFVNDLKKKKSGLILLNFLDTSFCNMASKEY